MQLQILKSLLGSPQVSDEVLMFYLDSAGDIIKDLRNSDKVEDKYLNTQLKIAIEMFNKRGAEGQVGHSENGIGRSYEKASISPSLLNEITPVVKSVATPVRVIE